MNALLRPAALAAMAWLAATAVQAATVTVQVIDKDGAPVADAVVVVTPAAASVPPKPAPTSATIVQEKMQFLPAVTVVQAGSKLVFSNQDSWEHHVRGTAAGMNAFAAGNAGGFELRLDGKGPGGKVQSAEVQMAKAGPVLLGCHIHGSMRGYVYVSESPWATKTGPDGVAIFEGLPDGATQVRVWQPEQLLDLPARTVTAGSSAQKVEFKLSVVPRRRRA
jgi:plastocyanin